MENSLFIDTGALIARAVSGDQHEVEARQGWEQLGASARRLYSSEPVLIETANYLARIHGSRFAAEWLHRHLMSKEIRWLQPDPDDFDEACGHLKKLSDQRISATDAISFALMRRHGLQRVFGFDRHFSMAGFELWPA